MNQPPYEVLFGNNPTNPKRGPYLGRSSEISAGDLNCAVLSSFECDVADLVTLCLTRRDIPSPLLDPADPKAQMPIVASLTFGTGQEFDTVSVDWLNGTLLTMPAASITLVGQYPLVGGGAVQPKQHLGVMISPGARAPSAGEQPLARLTTTLGALPQVALVPNRAQAVRMLTDTPAFYGSTQLSFRYRASTVVGAVGTIARIIPTGPEEVALPNGCRSIEVASLGGPAQNITLIWSIAL